MDDILQSARDASWTLEPYAARRRRKLEPSAAEPGGEPQHAGAVETNHTGNENSKLLEPSNIKIEPGGALEPNHDKLEPSRDLEPSNASKIEPPARLEACADSAAARFVRRLCRLCDVT